MTNSHFLFALSGKAVSLVAKNINPVYWLSTLESNFSLSLVIITEENVNVFHFDNVQVKVELTEMESEGRRREEQE